MASHTIMISYQILPRSQISDDLILKCANLFSSHYGIWSDKGTSPGKSVKLSTKMVKELFLFDDDTFLVIATHNTSHEIVGHVIGRRFFCEEIDGFVAWITQLVVHSDYRNQGISTRLCQMAWNPTENHACGLVTSHPYAVRALEKSTNSEVDPEFIMLHSKAIIESSSIPYLMSAELRPDRCVINTKFYVSHDEVDKIRHETEDWKLGELEEGEEFIAVCFLKVKRRRKSIKIL